MMNTVSRGFWAGVIATSVMTLQLFRKYHKLPEDDQTKPLPPATLTGEIVEKTGLIQKANRQESMTTTLISHYAYGIACGILYSALSSKVKASPRLTGNAFGLGVWALSYLGWIPFMNLRTSAPNMSTKKNMMMVTSHLAFGSTLGFVEQELRRFGDTMLDARRTARV